MIKFQWEKVDHHHEAAELRIATGPPVYLEVIEVELGGWRASVYLGDQTIADFDCEGFDDGKPWCEDAVRKWAKAVAKGLGDG